VYPLRTCAHLPATGAVAGKRGRAGHACPRAGTGACLAPCSRPLNGEYEAVVTDVRRVLEGHGADLDQRLRERQAAMVQALAFEQAARLQHQRETLERALRSVRRLQAAQDHDAVLVYPARRAGWAALWGVRGGRIVAEREVGRSAFTEAGAAAFIGEVAMAVPAAAPLPAAVVDEILLVHGWLQEHREAVNVLDLGDVTARRRAPAEMARELVERVRLCATAGATAPALP
jgi:excinuclease UvrABC nuclease subunit